MYELKTSENIQPYSNYTLMKVVR